MASTPISPFVPGAPLVDNDGRLTKAGYDYLHQMEVLLNKLRAAALSHGWTL